MSKVKKKQTNKKHTDTNSVALRVMDRVWWRRVSYFFLGMGVAVVVLAGLAGLGYWGLYYDRVFPGVRMAGVELEGLRAGEAELLVQKAVDDYFESWPVVVAYDQVSFEIPYDLEAFGVNIEKSVAKALEVGRKGTWQQRVRDMDPLQERQNMPLEVSIDAEWMETMTASMSALLTTPDILPRMELLASADPVSLSRVMVHDGMAGKRFEEEVFMDQWLAALTHLSPLPPELPVSDVLEVVTESERVAALTRGEQYIDKEMVVVFADNGYEQAWALDDGAIIGWMNPKGGWRSELMLEYLEGVAQAIEREPINAKLAFDTGSNKVSEFAAAKPGVRLLLPESARRLEQDLDSMMNSEEPVRSTLVVSLTEPEISLSQVNDLGIRELLGRGESTYLGSIASRVHNVALAASRINGTVIKPGEEFSFNGVVGEISGATGYQAAYVIQNGRTVLGDGGGVCQDSTTVFRAALDAGLPIVERRAHSYRVGYYEQNAKAGMDATVYSPTTDLQFLNDTPAHILIQAIADSANRHLVVEIYGTSDGRESTISNHVVWDVTPPPPDVYVDDATLAPGAVRQVDWKAWGAKAKFDYVVKRGDEVLIEHTFYSTFKPWAAVYLRGIEAQ